LRIAFTTVTPNEAPVAAESLQALQDTAQLCATLGHQVDKADPAIDRAAVIPTFLSLMAANTVVNLSSHPTAGRPAREDEVEKVTWASAHVMGAKLSAADYGGTQARTSSAGRWQLHTQYDVLLTPALMLPRNSAGST
jgi:Asp-tRNA(Asn)/Glu-tRNA(Gln) amidotransferase A subunit family amidase